MLRSHVGNLLEDPGRASAVGRAARARVSEKFLMTSQL